MKRKLLVDVDKGKVTSLLRNADVRRISVHLNVALLDKVKSFKCMHGLLCGEDFTSGYR